MTCNELELCDSERREKERDIRRRLAECVAFTARARAHLAQGRCGAARRLKELSTRP